MLTPGTQVGGYRIDGVIGTGGMGAVYRATQLSLKREVALKILASELAQDESFRTRFRREGEIQASIDHPNIVTIYEAGHIGDDHLFIAMRLIRGPSLKALVQRHELNPARTLSILRPIAEALDTAHQHELIHRDVKPQNILVDARDRAYLADFGLTKSAHDAGLTRTGQVVGTIDYISPEQIRGEPATPASDIYALAAVLFECLTGIVPFARPSDAAVLYAHITEPPPLLSEQRPDLPPALDEVLTRGMTKYPPDRHTTATELIDEAERAFGGRLRLAPSPPVSDPEDVGRPGAPRGVTTAGVGIPAAPTQPPVPRERSPETRAAPPRPRLPAPSAPPAGRTAGGQRKAAGQPTADVGPEKTAADAPGWERRRGPQSAGPSSARRGTQAETAAIGAAAGRVTATIGALRAGAAGRAAAVTGVIVLASVAGLLLGRSGAADDPPTRATTSPIALAGSASSRVIELGVPAGWRRGEASSGVRGWRLRDTVDLTAPELSGAGVSAGLADADDRTLLSTALKRRLARSPGSGEGVRLGELQAYRYRELVLKESTQRLRLYVAPSSAGVVNIACFAEPAELARLASTCDRIAQSVRLLRGEGRPLGPDPRYAAQLSRAIARVRAVRGPARRRLARASTPGAQGRELRRLAGIHGAAARSLRGVEAGPAESRRHGDLVAALTAARAAYTQMASAATAGRRGAYARASAAVRRSDGAARAALAGLRELGYRLR